MKRSLTIVDSEVGDENLEEELADGREKNGNRKREVPDGG